MPIFEYHCPSCDEDFEKIVSNAKTKVQCPRCSSGKVTKKLSAFSFKSGSKFVASSSNSAGCSSCASHHCSTCH
jgi:putative FmdB family regulatory protein